MAAERPEVLEEFDRAPEIRAALNAKNYEQTRKIAKALGIQLTRNRIKKNKQVLIPNTVI